MSRRRFCLAAAVLVLSACAAPNPPVRPTASSARPALAAGLAGLGIVPASYQTPEPPIELLATDGNALRLASVEASTVVEGPLAFTELKLGFDNHEQRIIEGRFRVVLPPSASLGRFAMKNGEAWQEGEVIEKKDAQRIYDDFLHRRVDPALLERSEGNAFSARVFPIAPRARKELIVSYSQEIGRAGEPLVALRGLPAIPSVSLKLSSPGQPERTFVHADWKPDADLVAEEASGVAAGGLRHEELAVVRVTPVTSAPADLPGATMFLVDTSASRALGLEAEIALVGALVASIATTAGEDTTVVVAGFDQQVQLVHHGPAGGWGEEARARLRERGALGASDLLQALNEALPMVRAAGVKRLVLVTDGVVTAGPRGAKLHDAVRKLGRAGIERLDAVAVGGLRDDDELGALVSAGLARDGVVVDAAAGAAAVWSRLGQATRSDLQIEVEGASWYWPHELDGIQPGDTALVYAELPARAPLRVSIDGQPVAMPALATATRPLLERSLARARIASLLDEERREGASAERTRQIVELSTGNRVLSPYTALLVLETEWDYQRYGLDRRSLADILTIAGGRLALVGRGPRTPPDASVASPVPSIGPSLKPSAPSVGTGPGFGRDTGDDPLSARGQMWGDAIGDSFGVGGLGLTGIGEGGGGGGEGIGLGSIGTIGHGAGSAAGAAPAAEPAPLRAPAPAPATASGPLPGAGTGQGFGGGHGRLAGSHRARPPQVRMGATAVSGRLATEVIQRIVRAQFGRLSRAYTQALRDDPNLSGRYSVRFRIGPDGLVQQVAVASADARSPALERAITDVFRGMRFPTPDGGTVTVVYPIVFRSSDEGAPVADVPIPAPPPFADEPSPTREAPRAHEGPFAEIMEAIGRGDRELGLARAVAWRQRAPGDLLALTALGEVLEARGDTALAARAYGSIIDMFPARADLRRFAGSRLERLGGSEPLALAVDTYEQAAEQRPDHPTSHRLLAFALLKQGRHADAFARVRRALGERYRGLRFQQVAEVLREDLGLIAAAWIKAQPARRQQVLTELAAEHVALATQPSLRFVLSWETDTNDVDLHVYDGAGAHAYFRQMQLASGGRLHGDVTTGYGPEMFSVEGPRTSPGYLLEVHYYSRGPMGYGLGKVEVIEHDGQGGLRFDERPFVVMNDGATVSVGTVGKHPGTHLAEQEG